MAKQLVVPAIPNGIAVNPYFDVSVRLKGESAWQKADCYFVKVDMHDVRAASMCAFEFAGAVELRVTAPVSVICDAKIRPLNENISGKIDGNTLTFALERPCNLSIEINGDRFHNLHLFAGHMLPLPAENVLLEDASSGKPHTVSPRRVHAALAAMPKGRTLVFSRGLHYIGEYLLHIPSDTRVHIALGAVVIGAFILENVENVTIEGHGVIIQQDFHRFSGINGIRASHCRHIRISGLHFINPPHYTVLLGASSDVTIDSIKTFSCEGWSDGIDIMACERVKIQNCFIRTSDDCIALYGRRWQYHGDTRDITVVNCALWADVAHPTIIGTHGDYENGGNILERITFKDIDILEHHEYQDGYLGCLTINVGDQNMAREILYEDIRIEHIERGKVLDVQVRFNKDYNPLPGKAISRVVFRNITYLGENDEPSQIAGYSENERVSFVTVENYQRRVGRAKTLLDARIVVGEHADNISIS